MSIAENIKLLRDWKGISQEELATIANVSDGSVSNWENAINEPRMGAIQRIADYYGLLKSHIIEDNGIRDAMNSKKPVQEDELSDQHKHIIQIVEGLTDHQVELARKYLELLVEEDNQ